MEEDWICSIQHDCLRLCVWWEVQWLCTCDDVYSSKSGTYMGHSEDVRCPLSTFLSHCPALSNDQASLVLALGSAYLAALILYPCNSSVFKVRSRVLLLQRLASIPDLLLAFGFQKSQSITVAFWMSFRCFYWSSGTLSHKDQGKICRWYMKGFGGHMRFSQCHSTPFIWWCCTLSWTCL